MSRPVTESHRYPTDDQIEAFLHRITKSMFVWRMANGKLGNARGPELEFDSPLQRSAWKSKAGALKDIREAFWELIK